MLPPSPDLWYGTTGAKDAKIVVVCESPLTASERQELHRMFVETGVNINDCLFAHVVAAQPPGSNLWHWFTPASEKPDLEIRGLHPTSVVVSELQRLHTQIKSFPRTLVIAVGNYSMWAVSSKGARSTQAQKENGNRFVPIGIMKWRGSMTYADVVDPQLPMLPIITPSAILKQWDLRTPTIHDLKARVPMALAGDWKRNPPPVIWACPTFEQAIARLDLWLRRADAGEKLRLADDIETTRGLIACIGFADSVNFAMSIPFMKRTPDGGFDSYWSTAHEVALLRRINRIHAHPNILLEGQNFIYDTQYIHHWTGVLPRCDFDCMLGFHLLFPGVTKGLDYLSSLFCRYHSYWKDDGKEWDSRGATIEQLCSYNAEDCLRTFEIATTLRALIPHFGMSEQWEWIQRKRDLALRMMLRGVRIDEKLRDQLGFNLMESLTELQQKLLHIVPQSLVPTKAKTLWPSSPAQTKWVFGDFLGMRIPKHRKTKNETLGKEALNELPKKYPEWTRLFGYLGDVRSVGVFITHFIRAPLDPDRRMRCSFNPAGTETFRWSSSKNAFGRGANLQNLSKGDED